MEERTTLSRLRARIRAGDYQDDLHSSAVNRLIFLRRLVQQGCVSEWIDGDGALKNQQSSTIAERRMSYSQ